MDTIKDKKSKFIYLNQSQGGIFKAPFWGTDGTQTNSIGSHGCWNCVCVYVPLDKDFCFAAHIDAWVYNKFPDKDNGDMIPPRGSEENLKNRVKQMLKQEILPWLPKEGLTEERNRRSIMVNLRPTVAFRGVSTKATGWYIAEAIQEFFGLLGNSEDQHALGFVINHVTAETEYFRWSNRAVVPTAQDLDRFEAYERINMEDSEESNAESNSREYPSDERKLLSERGKDWRFGYHEGVWYSKAEMLSKGYWAGAGWD